MQENLNQEIKGWLKDGFELTTVLRRLEKREMPREVALLAYRQAFNEFSKERIKRPSGTAGRFTRFHRNERSRRHDVLLPCIDVRPILHRQGGLLYPYRHP